ncbi:hypothetical protein BK731_05700 [Bacillus thuringiensis serovar muju]|nr:hypothetical protein BK731_05700 [Bacillus thuringiensis serovar muju]QDQ04190.1 hypothetical protein EKQ63_03385 [Bacillus sp. BD59S]
MFSYHCKFKKEDQENRAGRGALDRRTRSVVFLHEYRTGNATTTCEGYLNQTFKHPYQSKFKKED